MSNTAAVHPTLSTSTWKILHAKIKHNHLLAQAQGGLFCQYYSIIKNLNLPL